MLQKIFRHLLIERPAKKKSEQEWAKQLSHSGQQIESRLVEVEDSEKNRRFLNHIVGIERWGQRRLKVWLGEPIVEDEYNNYRPPREANWGELKQAFSETRRTTVELIEQLANNGVNGDLKVRHNQHGELSLRGWLRYLDMHADFESKRLK